MAREVKRGRNKNISLQVVPEIYDKFMELCMNKGLLKNEGFERMMLEVISTGEIPEPAPVPDEQELEPRTEETARIQALEQQLRHLQEQMSKQLPNRFTQLPPSQGLKPPSKRNQKVAMK